MRVLVLGAGGIGGYFGGRLVEGGADVTFLVREKRAEKLKTTGLVIESPVGDVKVEPKIATKIAEPFDLIILSCKAYDLDDAMAAIRSAVGDETTILPLLNGVAHLEKLDAAFGEAQTIGGLAHISVSLGAEGQIQHHNKLQKLTYGPRDESQKCRCEALASLFQQASFDVRESKNILQEMWEKFAFITAAGAIACLMRATTGQIMAAEDGERLTLQLLGECNAVAEAAGYPIGEKAQGWAAPFLTDRNSDFMPSMLRDLENGGKVEAEHLQGDMIRSGAEHRVAADLLKIAFCNLQAYEARRASSSFQLASLSRRGRK